MIAKLYHTSSDNDVIRLDKWKQISQNTNDLRLQHTFYIIACFDKENHS